MQTTRSLYVVAGITLVHLAWAAWLAVASPESLLASPWSLAGVAVVGALLFVLVPVFFAALYVDAGAVAASGAPWSPDRRLWVGGGVLLVAAAYVTVHSLLTGVVGAAYLLKRARVASLYSPEHAVAEAAETPAASDSRAEQSVAGVAVHVVVLAVFGAAIALSGSPRVGLAAAAVAAALAYATSEQSFTRANAGHALDWYLSVLAFNVASTLTLAAGADDGHVLGYAVSGPLLPEPYATAVALLGLALFVLSALSWAVTVAFAVVAAVQAARGTAWSYPLAAGFVARLARTERTD
ncbi:DUF4870 domain-containing protein [Halobacterium sp. NMX12-1]|uniref:DUF4870 domain-containing protein n=1 Tax=Halobacterium sp. NMX12-1 TaxID=3166650 RepID=A0AAU8CCQ7_9EURY